MKNKLDSKINVSSTLNEVKEARSMLLMEFLDISFDIRNIDDFNNKVASLNLAIENITKLAAKDTERFYNH